MNTTPGKRALAELHHRMPAILGREDLPAWLDLGAQPGDLQALLRPCPDGWLQAHEVRAAVGSVMNQGAELISQAKK